METNIKKVIILAVLALAVVVVAIVLSGAGQQTNNNTNNNTGQQQNDPIVVTHTDLASASSPQQKIPAGMPSSIPLELDNVLESYTMNYTERGLVQYSVSYTTSQSKAAKYRDYLNYMTQEGYEFGQNGRNEQIGSLYGTKNNDDLHVVINDQTQPVTVYVTYVDRQ